MSKRYWLVNVLDASGSMSGLSKATVEGYNKFLLGQKEQGKTLVSTYLFNSQSTVVRELDTIEEALMNHSEYRAEGNTALYDAVGKAIEKTLGISQHFVHDFQIIVNIMTDGAENASTHYTLGTLKALIQECQEKYHWTFIFSGANIDVSKTAANMNIKKDYVFEYQATEAGVDEAFEQITQSTFKIKKGKKQ